jgi:hypothetical protein
MTDDTLYLQATNEANGKAGSQRNDALWSKAMTLAEENEIEAKYKYINLRIIELKKELLDNNSPSDARTSVSSVVDHPDYISVAKYSAKNCVDERHVIQSIQEGSYKGQKVGDAWYVYIGKSRFGTFEDRQTTFFSNTANEQIESKQIENDLDKVISLRKNK